MCHEAATASPPTTLLGCVSTARRIRVRAVRARRFGALQRRRRTTFGVRAPAAPGARYHAAQRAIGEAEATGLQGLSGIAVDDQALYYTAGAVIDVVPTASDGGIPRANLDVKQGDALWKIAKRGPAKPVQVAVELGLTSGLFRDGDYLYFGHPFDRVISRVPKRGGIEEPVVSDPKMLGDWLVDGGVVFYMRRTPTSGDVVRATVGEPPRVILNVPSPPAAVAIAKDMIYVATGLTTDRATIYAVPANGGAATMLGKRPFPPVAMAVRGDTLVLAEAFRIAGIALAR